MNDLCLIIYYTILTVIVFLINELLIAIFDPSIKTRNRIHKLTLISFFSVFAIVPFKIIQGLIIQGSRIVKGDSLIILTNKIDYISEYTNFAYLMAFLISIISFSLLFIIFFDKKMMYRLYHLRPLEDKKIKKKLKKISVQMDIKSPELYLVRDSLDVFAFGLNPKLALGEKFITKCTEKEIEIALKHELWHIKNKDLLMKVMGIFLKILFFYNPAIFLLIRKIEKESEYMADIFSAKTKEEKKIYIGLMLKLSSLDSFKSPVSAGTTNAFPVGYPGTLLKLNRHFSMRRVENLFKIRNSKRFLFAISLFFTVFLTTAGISLGSFLAEDGVLNESYSKTHSYCYFDTTYYSAYTEVMEDYEYIIIHKNDFKVDKSNIKEKAEKLEYKRDNYELLILAEGQVFSEEIQEYMETLKWDSMGTNFIPDTNATIDTNSTLAN